MHLNLFFIKIKNMKNNTVLLSLLGIGITVSAAIFHTSSMGNSFCVARWLNDEGQLVILTYEDAGQVSTLPASLCANILTVSRTLGATGSYTVYGYGKTTLPGATCQPPPPTGCQRLRLLLES